MKRSSASSPFFLCELCVQITRPRPGRRGAEAAELRALIPALPSRRAARVDFPSAPPKNQVSYRSRKKNGPHAELAELAEFSRAARCALECIHGRDSAVARNYSVGPLFRSGALRSSREAAGTADGGRRGRVPSAFFGYTFPASAPRDPPFGFTRCAIPRTVPSRETCANAPGLLAGPCFARSRIGASWGPAPVRVRQSLGAGVGRGWRDRYLPKKTRMAPCRASIPLPLPTRPHTRGATPRLPACPDTIPLHRGSSRPCRA
jgi:hypothetical protein